MIECSRVVSCCAAAISASSCVDSLLERPVAPADEQRRDDQDEAAADRELLAGLERRAGFFARLRARRRGG